MFRALFLMVVVLALMGAAIAGCGGSSDSATDSASTGGEATTSDGGSDPLAQKFDGTADLGDLQITVKAPVDDTANLDPDTKDIFLEPGEKAIYCMVTIVNNGDEQYAYNTLSFTMYDTEGMSYESLFNVSTQPDLGSGDLLPGKTVQGAVSFAMPETATPDYVNFQRDIVSDTEASWGS